MVTCRSHKPEDAGSNLAVATKDDLAQSVESYPDTVEVESSSLSVITNLVRNSIGFRVPVFYTGSCEFESHRANQRMNSSTAEQVFVRHQVESLPAGRQVRIFLHPQKYSGELTEW